jgi:hypothetical protein
MRDAKWSLCLTRRRTPVPLGRESDGFPYAFGGRSLVVVVRCGRARGLFLGRESRSLSPWLVAAAAGAEGEHKRVPNTNEAKGQPSLVNSFLSAI